jgi:acetylornithine deacetylase/succinyl-diaminopimelate desuccinylase-like protein
VTTLLPAEPEPLAESVSQAFEYTRRNRRRFVRELAELLAIPSVSSQPERAQDVVRAAQLLAWHLKRIGLDNVAIVPTAGHPLVYGDWLHRDDAPTVLCYGHYDVQPAEPFSAWRTPPFEPAEVNGHIVGRGACDDKGPLVAILKGLEALLRTAGELPVNVRVVAEGEEETGGAGLDAYLRSHPHRFSCDGALVLDTDMVAPDTPTLTVGLRGIVALEVDAVGAATDLHSGVFGGVAPNPLVGLSHTIATLCDEHGRVLVPGFLDRVVPPRPAELEAWAALPFDEEHFRLRSVGACALIGEKEFPALQRTWTRPTFDVHGISGGYTGNGIKTVIPARASAKVSFRLVPDQDPTEITELIRKHLEAHTPPGITLSVRVLGKGAPVLIDTTHPLVTAGARALHRVFGQPAVVTRCGGGVPVVAMLRDELGVPAVMMGFALADDGAHAPNERFALTSFSRAIDTVISFLAEAGTRSKPHNSASAPTPRSTKVRR